MTANLSENDDISKNCQDKILFKEAWKAEYFEGRNKSWKVKQTEGAKEKNNIRYMQGIKDMWLRPRGKALDSQSSGPVFKTTGGCKVDSVFHSSEVDKMSTSNFWEFSGKK